jgi:hypothetical protein
LNISIGVFFFPKEKIYLSFSTGPSFIKDRRTLLALKPSVGFYFSADKKWTGKFSYTNLVNLKYQRKSSFAFFSFSIGHQLF